MSIIHTIFSVGKDLNSKETLGFFSNMENTNENGYELKKYKIIFSDKDRILVEDVITLWYSQTAFVTVSNPFGKECFHIKVECPTIIDGQEKNLINEFLIHIITQEEFNELESHFLKDNHSKNVDN